jgi:L-asparaginase II
MSGGEWPADAALVAAERGGRIENVHRGRICVVRADDGEVAYALGDAEGWTYVRSAAKPVQAIGPLLGGVMEAYGLQDRHLALMCASHRGTVRQVEALEEMLRWTGIPEDALAMRPVLPAGTEARDRWVRAGAAPRRLFHNCAGKHLGVLAWCKREGWPLAGYTDPAHPAQREIARHLAAWAGLPPEGLRWGTDGCGFPAAAMPLRRLARMYGRLATAGGADAAAPAADDPAVRAAARAVRAMTAHPELVEGPGRLASLLMQDGGIVAKSGAQGVFAFGLRQRRLGVAIAISSGGEAAWPAAVKQVLAGLGALTPALRERLDAAFPDVILSDTGAPAGRWSALFTWPAG